MAGSWRWLAVLVCLVVGLPARAGWAAGAKARRTNLVFILADDLGWSDLGCYGNRLYRTPRIDALAAGGARFTNFYCQAACMPSRVGLLTGMNPSRFHDLYGAVQPCLTIPWEPLPPGEGTWAEALRSAGYATGHIGKWGVRHWKDEGEGDRGFAWMACHQPWYYLPNYLPPYEGEIAELKGRDAGHLVDYMTGRAEAFLEEHRDGPFALVLSHFAVHEPLKGQGKPAFVAAARERARALGVPVNADYAALVEGLDDSTGRILDKLDSLGLADHTVVFFLSDNGGVDTPESPGEPPVTSNAPLRAGKATIYEGGLRVPCIVRWPGTVAPGTVRPDLASLEDVYPTFLAMAGVPLPAGKHPDGFSLAPVLAGTGSTGRTEVALQWEGAMLRRNRYKLIEFPPYVPTLAEIGAARAKAKKKNKEAAFTPPTSERLRIELYDLEADPGEAHDLAAERPALVKELRPRLHDWMKRMHGADHYSLERVRADARSLGQVYPDP